MPALRWSIRFESPALQDRLSSAIKPKKPPPAGAAPPNMRLAVTVPGAFNWSTT
jgi:hypothetical protein